MAIIDTKKRAYVGLKESHINAQSKPKVRYSGLKKSLPPSSVFPTPGPWVTGTPVADAVTDDAI